LININISDIKTSLGDMAFVVKDTAHQVTTVVNTLPGMASQVTEIHAVTTTLKSLAVRNDI
jgi:hypothetical protein